MPRNQVSIEELRCRIMKLKNNAYYDVVEDIGEDTFILESSKKHLSYVLDILDEYRF